MQELDLVVPNRFVEMEVVVKIQESSIKLLNATQKTEESENIPYPEGNEIRP